MTSTLLVLKRMGITVLIYASLSGLAHASQAADVSQEESVIVEYSSVFEGYTEWEWEDVSDWRQANTVVDEVGGWEFYAREPEEARQITEVKFKISIISSYLVLSGCVSYDFDENLEKINQNEEVVPFGEVVAAVTKDQQDALNNRAKLILQKKWGNWKLSN